MLNENDKQGVTRQSRWKTLGIAALSFFFAVLGIFMKINMSMGYTPIEISQSVLPMSIEELLSLIDKYYDVKIIKL
ncbi:MAG: hypothetical protein KKA10_07910 [Euryarchaeota archaeon]|nr:hypothetical protein [Euryarchaeota archaeon]MCG2737310.1 hypothetical protein [Candidatus Methanoperedenaceae archaeon]MDP3105053.1 hypothetical protein [Candidatus Methanoperedens sp.]